MNHRKILDGMFEACGVEPAKFRTICSAVDKLDKVKNEGSCFNCWVASQSSFMPTQLPWEDVRDEMVKEKGLDEGVADRIGHYVKKHGAKELVEELSADTKLMSVENAKQGLEDMKLLLHYCELFGVLGKVLGGRGGGGGGGGGGGWDC